MRFYSFLFSNGRAFFAPRTNITDLPTDLSKEELEAMVKPDGLKLTYAANNQIKGVKHEIEGFASSLEFSTKGWTADNALLFKQLICICKLRVYYAGFWVSALFDLF